MPQTIDNPLYAENERLCAVNADLLAACEFALETIIDHGGEASPTARILRAAIAKARP